MNIRNYRQLRGFARERLDAAPAYGRIVMIFAGIVLGLSELGGGAYMQNGILYFEISGTVMFLSFTTVYVLSGLVLGKGRASPGRSYQEVTAEMGERIVRFRALTDSGNLLRDPMSGRKVIVVESRAIAPLFDGMTGELLQSLEALAPETALEIGRASCRERV